MKKRPTPVKTTAVIKTLSKEKESSKSRILIRTAVINRVVKLNPRGCLILSLVTKKIICSKCQNLVRKQAVS